MGFRKNSGASLAQRPSTAIRELNMRTDIVPAEYGHTSRKLRSRKEVGELDFYAMCGSLARFSDASITVRR